MSTTTFLATNQLAERIQYDVRTIREQLKDSVWYGLKTGHAN